MSYHGKWDERQRGVWNRAWRRTCILILAAVWANSIFGPWGGRWDQAFYLLLVAVVAVQVQAVWGGAYLGPHEETPLNYLIQAVGGVAVAGMYVWNSLREGAWVGGGSGAFLVLTLMFGSIPLTMGARWIFDHALARARGSA